MNNSKRKLTRKDSLRAYQPRLENLEERWMPGDTVLSGLLGQAVLAAGVGSVNMDLDKGGRHAFSESAALLPQRPSADAHDVALLATSPQAAALDREAAAPLQREGPSPGTPARSSPTAAGENADMLAGQIDLLAGLGTLDDLATPRERPLVHRDGIGLTGIPAAAAVSNADAMPNTAPLQAQPLTVAGPTSATAPLANPAFSEEIAALSLGLIHAAGPSSPTLVTPNPVAPDVHPSLGGSAGSGQGSTGPGGSGPLDVLNPFLETLQVPTENAAGVTSQAVLERGVTYTLYAWGDFQYGATTADRGDAQYRKFSSPTPYSGDGVSHIGVTLSGVMVLGGYPPWGSYSAQHRYRLRVVGMGAPLHAFYLDTPGSYSTHHGSLSLALDPPGAAGCAPPDTPPAQCCGQNGDLSKTAQGADGGYDSSRGYGEGGVRYFDLQQRAEFDLLSSDGFGTDWGVTLTDADWANDIHCAGTTAANLGPGVADSQQPDVTYQGMDPSQPNELAIDTSSPNVRYFTRQPDGSYKAHDFQEDTVVLSGGAILYADSSGRQLRFNDFTQHPPTSPPGQLVGEVDRAGHQTNASYDSDGRLTMVSRTGPNGGSNTVTETYMVSYTDGTPGSTVSAIDLNRHANGQPDTTVRRVKFTYYAGGQAWGPAGYLELAEVQEPDSQGMMTFDTYYYRYDASNLLEMVFKPQSYDRLIQHVSDALNQPDTAVQAYADYVFTRGMGSLSVTVQGEGCSSCSGGQGTFSYVKQTPLMTFSDAYNHWHYETIETLPDNSTRTVFANYRGETMLSVFQSGGQSWETFYKYEDGPSNVGYGRTLWVAQPSAILYNGQGQGYDPNSADLMVADQNGHYTFLKDNQGLVYVYDYYADSNGSGENTPGHAQGYLADMKLQMGQAPSGQMPSPITRTTYQYYQHAATSGGFTVFPLATQTDYQNADGTGAELTQYAYTWLLDAGGHPTAQPQTLTVQKPLIPTSQNGPGGTSYDVTTTTFDPYGRVIQTVDPDNKVVNYTYDQATGAVTQMVQDAGGVSQVNLAGAFTTGRVGIATDGMSFSGVGLDGSGNAYSATFTPNGALTWNTRPFTLGPANQADVVVAAGQTITLPAASASSLSLLATAVGGTGQQNQGFTVTYSDGSTQTFSRSLSDWLAPQNYPGEAQALTMPYYNTSGGGRVSQTATLYGYSFALNPAKPVQSLTLPNNSHVVLLAASLTNLDLTTTYTVDPFGRDTAIQEPNGSAQFVGAPVSVTYMTYNDFTHETRTYAWNGTTNTPVGPTRLTREDRSTATVYYETLTMSAAPHLTNNIPDGTEAISQVQSLNRDLTDNSGQVIEHDAYVDVGPGYSYSAMISGAHYNATTSAFDVRGRKNKTVSANNTIQRTVYDGLGRAVSTWIGTNDAGATDSDPTGNHTPGNNMIQVSAAVYDNGGTGDSTLTQTTQYPHGTTDTANPPRVTNMYYDWRDRRVYTWQGYQSPQDTTTHRPIIYLTFDNLDEVTGIKRYDGDTVTTVSFQNGVPSPPMSNLLRASAGTRYDSQGRVYETVTYRVATDGTILLTPLATDNWYNHRGLLAKTSAPGGLVQKMSYDGAGRETFVFTTDGAGDNGPNTAQGWSDAQQVNSSNNVLTQTQAQYDGDSNVVLQTTWDRYHNSTYGGDLSLAPTQQARVSFMGKFYDAADRLTNEVNYGNNGNTFLATRPTTIAPRGADAALKTDYSYLADTVQTVALSGSPTGNFKLSFNGSQLTDNIPVSATAALVQSRLQGLTTIGMNNVLVYGPAGDPWNVRFTGTLAGQDEPLLVANGSGLTGGTVSVARASQGGDSGRLQATTDPRGLVARTDYDLLGRTLRTVTAFTNNPAFMDPNWNQATEYAYDGDNHVTVLSAYPGDGSIEQTQYTYSANPADSSWISSNDQLTLVQYPDKSSGRPSTLTSDQETYLYDNLGETRSKTERTLTVHNYSYDVLGRPTQDSVGSFGTGVDQTVGALATAYDTYGNAATFTSYAPNGSSIVNQVQRTYNGFGQLTAETQYHGDPGQQNTPRGTVSYAYSVPAAGMNYSRLVSMTYPNGRQIDYSYGNANDTLDNSISRLTTITDHTTSVILETYIDGTNAYSDYLGLTTTVQRDHPQAGLNLTYLGSPGGDAGDQYVGLDRFGRVVDQNWQGPSGTTDRFQYAYDYDSNRLYRANVVTEGLQLAFDELYHPSGSVDTYNTQGQLTAAGYDVLNQMTAFGRGTLSADHKSIGSTSHTQSWSLDALGNWKQFTSDTTNQTRMANQQNEVVQISGASNPAFDNNGNTTQDDQGNVLKYDAWNRLVKVTGGMVILGKYDYDALGRRITSKVGQVITDRYYSDQWQVLEEDQGGAMTQQYVWSPVYVDALIDRDSAGGQRLYVQQDANWNVTALVDTTGAVQERFIYDPYGKPTDASGQNIGALNPNWTTRTGGDSFGWVYLFQGGRYEATTGLYNFRFRDYSPTLGRWMQVDPLHFAAGDTNFYRSERNDPTSQLDPTGLQNQGALQDLGDALRQRVGEDIAQQLLPAWVPRPQPQNTASYKKIQDAIQKLKDYCKKCDPPPGVSFPDFGFIPRSGFEKVIQDLINQLGSNTYPARNRAQDALKNLFLNLGIALLRQAANNNPDPEIKRRAQMLVDQFEQKCLQDQIRKVLDSIPPNQRQQVLDWIRKSPNAFPPEIVINLGGLYIV